MSITADITKNDEKVTATGRFSLPTIDLTEVRKPLLASVGVADLWIEQVKNVPADITAGTGRVSALVAEVPAAVRALPEQVKALRTEVEARVAKATEKAGETYAALSIRGERLVTQIRRQPATEAAIAEGKEAVKKAEAAAIAARKSAKAGERALQDAAGKIG